MVDDAISHCQVAASAIQMALRASADGDFRAAPAQCPVGADRCGGLQEQRQILLGERFDARLRGMHADIERGDDMRLAIAHWRRNRADAGR